MDTPVKRRTTTAILMAVASSQLSAIAYSPGDQVLTIQFPQKDGQDPGVYQYEGVSQTVFDSFNASPSKGSFFISQIKGPDRNAPNYRFVKLTQEEIAEHVTLPIPVVSGLADDPGFAQGGVNAARELESGTAQERQAA